MAGINATYVNTSTFTVVGDQTEDFDIGRRVKAVGSTNWYGTILSSAYSIVTTVTLTAASDDLDYTLTEVYYGIISGTEASSSTNIHTHDGDEGSGGQIDHVDLDNKGTNTHSAIDAHISDVTTNPHNVAVPLTTKGDVVGFDTEVTRLPVGTNGQVLTADSSEATGIKWISNPSGFSDPMTTRGDIIFKNSSGTTVRLPAGTNEQVLTSDGTDISWENPESGFADPMTTRGDIIYKNASGVTTRLPVGVDGQILTSDGTDLSWENYTAGGANLSEGNATQIAVDIDSDSGTNATLVSASTSRAGLLTKAKFDEIVANTSKSTNATHTGEVTGSGVLTIADNIVDEANLKLDEGAVNDYVLTADSTKSGGMKWAANPSGFNDPMTTRGDVIIRNSSNSTDKLSIGTNGQVLTSDGTDISWEDSAGGGNVSTSGTPVDNDFAKFVDGTDIEGRSYAEVKSDLAITASDVTDFDTEVANNSAVAANTSKVTNATHSGEVTGSGVLTIAANVVDEANLKLDSGPTNDYVLTADSTKSGGMKWSAASAGGANLSEGTATTTTVNVNSDSGTNATLVAASTSRAGLLTKAKFDEIVANTSKSTNATHTGEVTGSGTLIIASNKIDEDNLKLDSGPTNDYVLTADSTKSGGMKWSAIEDNDAVVLNTAKVSNISTSLSLGTDAANQININSDGGVNDLVLTGASSLKAGITTAGTYSAILNSTSHSSNKNNPHEVDTDDIYMESVYSINVTIQQLINKSQATGYFDSDNSGWFGANKGFTNNGDGTLDVAGGHGILRENDTAEDTAYFVGFLPATGPGLTMVDKSTNYIYVEWSSSVAVDTITTTTERTDLRTNILLGKVYRDGLDMEFFYGGNYIAELGENIVERFNDQDGVITRTSGAVVTETGTRNIAFSDAITYNGLLKHPITGYDTNVSGTFEYYYYNGSAWINSSQTAIDSANYNDTASGLTALSAGEYGVHWVFITSAGSMLVVYGQDSYTLADAEAAQIPASLPELVEEFSFLAAKIIIAKNATTFTEIQSSYDTSFQSGVDVDAEDVGITDSGSYYTGNNVEAALQEIGASNISTTGTPVDNDFAKFTDDNTIEGRSYSEVKTDLAITGTDVAVTDSAGYYTGTEVETILREIGDKYLLRNPWYGTFQQSFNALVSSDGISVITMSIQSSDSGDLTMQFSDGFFRLDCTPAATIELTAGTATSPQANYIYIPRSTKVLTKSTTGWPSTEHIKVSYFYVQDAVSVAGDGALINQNWNDELATTNGHITHIGQWIRSKGANWFSGCDGGGTDGYLTPYAGGATFQINAGVIMQMHSHSYASKDTSGTDNAHCPNYPGEAWKSITDINELLIDSDGDSLTGRYFNIIIGGVANKGGEYSPLMIKLPSGSYNSSSNAINDVDHYDDTSMPREFNKESSTGFLIARVTIRNQSDTTFTVMNTQDLRGLIGATASSSTGGTALTEFADNQFKVYNNTDATKIVSLDVSGLTTGNTRVITPSDAAMTIPSTADHTANNAKVGVTDEISNVVDDTSPQLGNTLDLNENYIQLKPVPASDESGSGDIANMTVDVNATGVAAALYMASDGNFEEADASSDTTLPCMAIALESSTGSKDVLLKGFMRDDTWNWTSIGQPVYVSTTAGGFTQTAPSTSGEFVQRVGIATHADRIFFNPDYTIIEIA